MKLKASHNTKLEELKGENAIPNDDALPKSVTNYLQSLSVLEDIPFSVLVPDERMLPNESLRFFYVDQNWIAALIDGAFSVGRFSTVENALHASVGQVIPQVIGDPQDDKAVTGFLLRSEVVKGWPGLEVNAYEKGTNKELRALRIDHLSPSVLLALFEGELGTIRIHEPAEAMHFGLDMPEGKTTPPVTDPMNPISYFKKVRKDGTVSPSKQTVSISYRSDQKLVLDISALAKSLKATFPGSEAFTPAEFAYQMVEGVGQVIFHPDNK